MSGQHDQGGTTPPNPFPEQEGPPRARSRRQKPPPGIITAGGVDMARAHASGIQVRDAAQPEHPMDEPRVVLSDPRKLPKRLLDEPEQRPDPAEEPGLWSAPSGRRKPALPVWMRAAAVLVLLLLVGGLARRVRMLSRAPAPAAELVVDLPPIVFEPLPEGNVVLAVPQPEAFRTVPAPPRRPPKARVAASSPKPAFTPPFQLPQEKTSGGSP